ncbi:calmodulin-like protein 6 isoform X2 [Kogia breviceps]|uniref:calmodulin-like protein 6 isoform X2 n=1 Tax=Kogia breviceps TaxID=27615 RepID=UPI0034D2235D
MRGRHLAREGRQQEPSPRSDDSSWGLRCRVGGRGPLGRRERPLSCPGPRNPPLPWPRGALAGTQGQRGSSGVRGCSGQEGPRGEGPTCPKIGLTGSPGHKSLSESGPQGPRAAGPAKTQPPPRPLVLCPQQLQRHRAVSPQPATDMTERLTAEQIEEYKGVFEMFDEEGNGAVKTDELERLMSLLGLNPTKSELASMAEDVDRDKRGFFNCDSFLALMGVYLEKAQNQETELRAAFRLFDKEGKGYIDWDTLKYVLMNAGEPLSELEAEQMMKEADKDGDGTIDYEEFVAMMTGESFKLVQ